MFRIERTIAFVIDVIMMGLLLIGLFMAFILLWDAAKVSKYIFLPFFTVMVGLPYNIIWIYYLLTGVIFKASIGKKVLGLRIENKENELNFLDLVKRYALLIIIGLIYTGSVMSSIANFNTVDWDSKNAFHDTYFLVIFLYFFLCNVFPGRSIYDQWANLRIKNYMQNKTRDQIAGTRGAID